MFSTEDTEANEALVHIPLLEHPSPRAILFVSGGLGGALSEVLKHDVRRVDYVELDARALRIMQQHLPPALQAPLHDPRVHLHYGDARVLVRETREKYDVVLINLPDPSTAVLNRYYTVEFFRSVARLLKPGGLVATRLSAPDIYLTGARRLLHSSVFRAFRQVFPEVLLVSDGRVQFLGALQPGVLTGDGAVLGRRLSQRGIKCAFVSDFWLLNRLMPFKRDQYAGALLSGEPAPINHDLRPASYGYYLQLWLSERTPRAARLLAVLRHANLPAALCFLLAACGLLALGGRRRNRRQTSLAVLIGGTGLLEMGLELVVIFGFQVAAGYLYYQIGLLLTLFMAGLALGAELARRWSGAQQRAAGQIEPSAQRRLWAALQLSLVLLILLALLSPLLLTWIIAAPATAPVLSGALAAIAGALGGFAFPLALALYGTAEARGRGASVLYAVDLVGGAAGGFLVAILLLPAFGLTGTVVALAALGAAALLLGSGLASGRFSAA